MLEVRAETEDGAQFWVSPGPDAPGFIVRDGRAFGPYLSAVAFRRGQWADTAEEYPGAIRAVRDLMLSVGDDPDGEPLDELAEDAFEMLHPRAQGGEFRRKYSRLGYALEVPTISREQRQVAYAQRLLPPDLQGEGGKTIAGHGLPPNLVPSPEGHPARKMFGPSYTVLHPEEGEREGGLVAVGVDQKGRVKREYTPESKNARAAAKFHRIAGLTQRVGDLDDSLRGDDSDDAAALRLVRVTGLRPGSEEDRGGDVEAVGASTLRGEHVQRRDDGTVDLRFVGKGGKPLSIHVKDPDVSADLLRRAGTAGTDGQVFPEATAASMGARLKRAIGPEYKTKDLRTVLATAMAQRAVSEMDVPESKAAAGRARNAVADAVAEQLGNTRAVALSSYIHPAVWSDWPG